MTDMSFNLGTKEKRKLYLKKVIKIAQKILTVDPTSVIFILSTYTDEERGNLFTRVEGGKLMSAEIQKVCLILYHLRLFFIKSPQFFKVVFNPFKDIIPNAILYILSCGQYVHYSTPYTKLTKVVVR